MSISWLNLNGIWTKMDDIRTNKTIDNKFYKKKESFYEDYQFPNKNFKLSQENQILNSIEQGEISNDESKFMDLRSSSPKSIASSYDNDNDNNKNGALDFHNAIDSYDSISKNEEIDDFEDKNNLYKNKKLNPGRSNLIAHPNLNQFVDQAQANPTYFSQPYKRIKISAEYPSTINYNSVGLAPPPNIHPGQHPIQASRSIYPAYDQYVSSSSNYPYERVCAQYPQYIPMDYQHQPSMNSRRLFYNHHPEYIYPSPSFRPNISPNIQNYYDIDYVMAPPIDPYSQPGYGNVDEQTMEFAQYPSYYPQRQSNNFRVSHPHQISTQNYQMNSNLPMQNPNLAPRTDIPVYDANYSIMYGENQNPSHPEIIDDYSYYPQSFIQPSFSGSRTQLQNNFEANVDYNTQWQPIPTSVHNDNSLQNNTLFQPNVMIQNTDQKQDPRLKTAALKISSQSFSSFQNTNEKPLNAEIQNPNFEKKPQKIAPFSRSDSQSFSKV